MFAAGYVVFGLTVPSGLCITSSVVAQVSALSSFLLQTVFAIEFLLQLMYEGSVRPWLSPLGRWQILVFTIIGILSVTMSFVPLFPTPVPELGQARLGYYEFVGAWCWISKTEPLARQILFYIPLYVCLVIMFICYSIGIYRVSKYWQERRGSKFWKIQLKLSLFPLVFMILWLPGIISRIYEAYYPPLLGLTLFQTVIQSLQGLANMFLFFLNRKSFYKTPKKKVISLTPSTSIPMSCQNTDTNTDSGYQKY
eukprot:TRINITY_DN7805_c0_g1_i2.p1 TRINITY_DN7805_c0_g1~~TRINITY_DN7805_c0_g1_i2.p1  ORF type:complete len:253 (-),score=7.91 TRINITY_DN7805_c0_g1_i2:88-846(-)